MNKKYIPWIVIGGVLLILIIWIASGYNGMLTSEQEVDNKWGDVQSQYQRRKDLIPNLENTVKKYAQHEEQTLTKVTEARNSALQAQRLAEALPQEMPADEQEMERYMQTQENATRALNVYVNAVTEAYPNLLSNQNFLDFQENLTGTENRIQVARANYNEAVKAYNVKVRSFPNVLISGMLGFQKKSMFRADADASVAPVVMND